MPGRAAGLLAGIRGVQFKKAAVVKREMKKDGRSLLLDIFVLRQL